MFEENSVLMLHLISKLFRTLATDFFYFVLGTLFCFAVQVHRACAEREILDMLDHPFLPALYASFQVRKLDLCRKINIYWLFLLTEMFENVDIR